VVDGLQYANKGLAQNMVSQGGGWYDMWNYVNDATGYRVSHPPSPRSERG
jgi:maltoporin